MKVTPKLITGILFGLNWQGHIELPDADIAWLGQEIASALSGNRRGRCENCGMQSTIIIKALIGDVCEDCISSLGRLVDDIRKDYENAS